LTDLTEAEKLNLNDSILTTTTITIIIKNTKLTKNKHKTQKILQKSFFYYFLIKTTSLFSINSVTDFWNET